MYSRKCYNSQPNTRSIPYVPKLVPTENQTKTVPESVRISREICATAVVTVPPPLPCYGSPIASPITTKLPIPVIPGYPVPLTEVGTTPASLTTLQKSQFTWTAAQNPYNPDTRFTQYFPPAPVPYQCPIRVPSQDPKPSVLTCQPIRNFQGSVAK